MVGEGDASHPVGNKQMLSCLWVQGVPGGATHQDVEVWRAAPPGYIQESEGQRLPRSLKIRRPFQSVERVRTSI